MRSTILLVRIVLLLLIASWSTDGIGQQKITEGKMDFGLVSAKLVDEESFPGTPEQLEQMIAGIRANADMTFYWNEDYVKVLKPIAPQDTLTVIYDLEAGLAYTLKEVMGEEGYTVEKTPESTVAAADLPLGEPFPTPIFGLDCYEFVVESPNVQEMKIYTTKDLDFSDNPAISPLQNSNGFMVKTKIVGDGVEMIMGIRSFTPKIEDESIFAIDTINRTNFTETRNDLIQNFEDSETLLEQVDEDFGEFESSAANHDLLNLIIADSWIDAGGYPVSWIMESKKDIDRANILRILVEESNILEKDVAKIEETLDSYGLNSPKVKLLLQHMNWASAPNDIKVDALVLGYSQDILSQSDTRSQIITNLERAKLLSRDNSDLKNQYLSGQVDLGTLMNEILQFTALPKKEVTSDEQILTEIKVFFTLLSDQFLNLEIFQKEDFIYISDGSYDHRIRLSDLKPYDYDRDNTSNSSSFSMITDFNFYNNLIPIVSQLAADQGSDLVFALYKYNGRVDNNIDEYDYESVLETFSGIFTPQDYVYLNIYPKNSGDPLLPLGISFDFHPLSENEELSLRSPFAGAYYAGTDYISSQSKEKFVQFLRAHMDEFDLTDAVINEIAESIRYDLIQDPNYLMRYLPNVKINCNITFKITPKSRYSPKFTAEKDDFKHAYPSLYRVIQDDFQATDFSYDAENHKVNFNYEGQSYTVDPGKINMLNFIKDHLTESKSGKRLFFIRKLSVTEKEYYYLSDEVAQELKAILSLKI